MSRRPLVLYGLLLVSTVCMAGDLDGNLEKLREAGWHVSEPLTVEEAETKSLEALRKYMKKPGSRQDMPLVPFGLSNARWVEFKRSIREGDVLVKLDSPAEYWASLRGWSGYAIVRDGEIAESLAIVVN